MDLELEMASRVRRHMLTVLAAVVCVIGFFVVAGFAAHAGAPGWLVALPMLGILAIPVIGFWSTFRNLRCPACNGLVAFQVSYQTSPFGGGGAGNCRHCGKKIFGDLLRRRARRMMIGGFAAGIGLGVVGAVANIIGAMHH